MGQFKEVSVTPVAYAIMEAFGLTVPHPMTPLRVMGCGDCNRLNPCTTCGGTRKVLTMFGQKCTR